MWCWATSLAITRDFYYHNHTTCDLDECAMARLNVGIDCCALPDMCEGTCAFGAKKEDILRIARMTIPTMKWQLDDFAPSEDRLIKLLTYHTPVLRIMADQYGGGHADIVGGCRTTHDENGTKIEYLVVDSMDPNLEWMNYNDSVTVPYAQDPDFFWRSTIWSPSFVSRYIAQHP